MKIISLVGARPQFIKEAVINWEFEKNGFDEILVHSGQHYDNNMSDVFFKHLNIKNPDYNLNIGSGRHGEMTGKIMIEFEKIVIDEKPDMVLVYGDTNTTLAGVLVASKLKIPVAHIEAGERQDPRDMPEEINRVLTDRISTLLLCASKNAVGNLKKEGIDKGVYFVGDTMYDVYLKISEEFEVGKAMKKYDLNEGEYVLATVHRDFNTDDPKNLKEIMNNLNNINKEYEVVFPMHPRTRKRLREFNIDVNFKIYDPFDYITLQSLVKGSKMVITDSGGLQKEAFYGGKRAIVVMPDTGWIDLVKCGWNRLSGTDEIYDIFIRMENEILDIKSIDNLYGDGNSAKKIIGILKEFE